MLGAPSIGRGVLVSAAASDSRRLVGLDEPAIVYVTSLGHALCHIGELAIAGAITAVMAEFNLEKDQVTLLPLPGYVLLGLGALPVGVWADTWGSTRVLMIYFVAMAVAGVAVALASNVWLLFGALTLLGLAASIYHPAGLTMISLGVRSPGRVMGINGVAGSIGVACGPALGMLAASLGMWRLAYLFISLMALICGVLMYWECRKARTAEQLEDAPQLDNGHSYRSPAPVAASSFWMKYGPLMFLMLAMMLGGFNYRCLVTALPTFLSGEQATGQALAKGAVYIFAALIVGCVGQYVGGWLADRTGGSNVYLALVFCLVLLAGFLGFLENTPFALPMACCLAFCLFAQQPVENAILAECTTVGRRSTSYGTKFALTFGVGAAGAQATGQVWERYGELGPVFWMIAASAALMGLMILAFMISRHRRGDRRTAAAEPNLPVESEVVA